MVTQAPSYVPQTPLLDANGIQAPHQPKIQKYSSITSTKAQHHQQQSTHPAIAPTKSKKDTKMVLRNTTRSQRPPASLFEQATQHSQHHQKQAETKTYQTPPKCRRELPMFLHSKACNQTTFSRQNNPHPRH